jgi:hypothetical protein
MKVGRSEFRVDQLDQKNRGMEIKVFKFAAIE